MIPRAATERAENTIERKGGQGSTAVYSLGRSPLIDSIVLQKLDGRLAKPGWID